jgi:hypothetical protein
MITDRENVLKGIGERFKAVRMGMEKGGKGHSQECSRKYLPSYLRTLLPSIFSFTLHSSHFTLQNAPAYRPGCNPLTLTLTLTLNTARLSERVFFNKFVTVDPIAKGFLAVHQGFDASAATGPTIPAGIGALCFE